MSGAQHTPTPYTFDGHSCIVAIGHTSDAQRLAAAGVSESAKKGELTVACLLHDMCPEQTVIYYSVPEARANGAFICRACNSHDALLAACEVVDNYFGGRDEVDPELCPTEYALIVRVSAAIAKAKELDKMTEATKE